MRLLLVEDHEDTCAVLTRILTRWGYDVDSADTVESALSFLNNFRFDVLLSDIGLPDGDGLQVVTAAKKTQAVPLAIALSAHGNASDRESGLRAGFDHYLAKPCDVYQLRRVLAGGFATPIVA